MSEDLKFRVKEMLVDSLMLRVSAEEIGDDDQLFDPAGLGLDSIDALELSVALEKNFGAKTPNAETARRAFQSVSTIVDFIEESGSAEPPSAS